jgi:hypothetical protein
LTHQRFARDITFSNWCRRFKGTHLVVSMAFIEATATVKARALLSKREDTAGLLLPI